MTSKAPKGGKTRDRDQEKSRSTRSPSRGRDQEKSRSKSPIPNRERSPPRRQEAGSPHSNRSGRSNRSRSRERNNASGGKAQATQKGREAHRNPRPAGSPTNQERRRRSVTSPAPMSIDSHQLVETDVWERAPTPREQGPSRREDNQGSKRKRSKSREQGNKISAAIKMAIEAAMAEISEGEDSDSSQSLRQESYRSPNRDEGSYDYSPMQSPHRGYYREEMEEGQLQEDPGEKKGLVLSEDEDLEPEVPSTTGLFHPGLFRSLLHKARATANLPPPTGDKQEETTSVDPIFDEVAARTDTIPIPKLFVEAITKQWRAPAGGALPNPTDKRYFNLESNLSQHLGGPTVDNPILALYTTAQLPGDAEDVLKLEDRRTETTLQRTHQAAAWTVRAAATTSFFCRTSLKWLYELKEHIPEGNTHAHRDLNKLLAAAQFTSDSSLQSARFAARAMGSALVARRMNWLRGWSVDVRHKWKLATTPVTGQTLFGEALDPFLVETKDKRKILPSNNRKVTHRSSAYARRGAKGSDNSYGRYNSGYQNNYQGNYQGSSHGQYQGQYGNRSRQGPDRNFKSNTAKRPFRGSSGRPFRRYK